MLKRHAERRRRQPTPQAIAAPPPKYICHAANSALICALIGLGMHLKNLSNTFTLGKLRPPRSFFSANNEPPCETLYLG